MTTKLIHKIYFLIGIMTLSCGVVSAQKFTIPVIPDTQESVTRQEESSLQIEWLAAKADPLNAPIVSHVGDLVNFNNFDRGS